MKNFHELPSSCMFSDRGFMFLQTERNAGDFTTFYHCWRFAGGLLEIALRCWRLQRDAGDLATMHHQFAKSK